MVESISAALEMAVKHAHYAKTAAVGLIGEWELAYSLVDGCLRMKLTVQHVQRSDLSKLTLIFDVAIFSGIKLLMFRAPVHLWGRSAARTMNLFVFVMQEYSCYCLLNVHLYC